MPSSHLPRTPCDKFIYDFLCDVLGIVGGYGLRHMCSHYLQASCDFFYGASGATWGKSVQRLCGDLYENHAMSPHPPHGNRTEPVRGSAFARCPCGDCAMPPTTCLRATGLQFFFKFVKLLAKPNRRGHGVRESVQKSHSRLLPPQGGLMEAAQQGGYGQHTGSVDPSQAKCELHILLKINLNEYINRLYRYFHLFFFFFSFFYTVVSQGGKIKLCSSL